MMTPPPAVDALCLRSGLDPMVFERARALAFDHAVCGCSDMLGTGSLSTETLGAPSGRAAVGSNQSFTLRIRRPFDVDAANGGIVPSSLLEAAALAVCRAVTPSATAR